MEPRKTVWDEIFDGLSDTIAIIGGVLVFVVITMLVIGALLPKPY